MNEGASITNSLLMIRLFKTKDFESHPLAVGIDEVTT